LFQWPWLAASWGVYRHAEPSSTNKKRLEILGGLFATTVSGRAKLLIAAKGHLVWRMGTRPQFGADENPIIRKSPAGEDSPDTTLLDAAEIAALRQFFALLDEWDKKKNLT
jgi:hypothetical protein